MTIEGEDLVSISERSSEGRNAENAKLKFGKYSVPLTRDEYADLEKRLRDYSEETGTYYGFARTLL